ncbi:MAG: heparinase II/III family protein [Kiritimatiellae bacterium]|nr:heparinase II/III family protein [Kiritimatiellia bacterium]
MQHPKPTAPHRNRHLRQLACVMLLANAAHHGFAATKIEALTLPLAAFTELVAKLEPAHPTLFGQAADFERLQQEMRETELGKAALAKLTSDSDYILKQKPLERVMQGRRLLGVSRGVLYRVTTLAMSYRLTGKPEYLKRCEAELLCASAFSDWNPSHFLDVAEMTLAIAVGYDWLYHDLTTESRALIYRAILEKGLQTSLKTTGWVRASNNWGQVCHAGMMAGALATFGQNREISTEIIHRAIQNLPRSMHAFAPQGAYPEGPGYWTYGTDFNILALDLLFRHLNTDFGLSTLPGFEATMDYMNIVTGPSGQTFNYADGGSGRGTDPALWWFAKHYTRPDILKYFEIDAFKKYCAAAPSKNGGNRLFAIGLLWLQTPPADLKIKTPLHWSSESKDVITVHRTSWDDQKALFVGFKGGSPSAPHGHMDAGSFVLDYAGIRWAWDLGAEGYHNIESRGMNLWSNKQDSERWTIFRLNNFSHNTLVIDNQLQLATGCATLKSFKAEPAPETVIDLTPVYKGQASSIFRAGRVLPSGELQITDTLEGLKPGASVRWAMMTKAKATANDTPVMTLTERDKALKLAIRHSAAARWQIIDAEKPRHAWDSPNKGCRLICFETIAPESGRLTLDVLITPGG